MARAGPPRCPASSSDRRSRATSSAARSVVDRGQRDRPLRQQLHQRAAGRHQDERPDEGVAPHPERHLDPGRHLGLHHHRRAQPVGEVGVRRGDGGAVAQVQADAVDVQLVVDVRVRRLEDDRVAGSVGCGHRRVPVRRPSGTPPPGCRSRRAARTGRRRPVAQPLRTSAPGGPRRRRSPGRSGGWRGRAGGRAPAGRTGCPRARVRRAPGGRRRAARRSPRGGSTARPPACRCGRGAGRGPCGKDSSPSYSGTRSTASATTSTAGSSARAVRQSASRPSASLPVPQTSSGLVGSRPGSRSAASRSVVARRQGRERDAEPLGHVGGEHPLGPGVVHGRDPAAPAAYPPSDGEALEAVGELAEVVDAVHAVRREQRLPRRVRAGEGSGVRVDQRPPSRRGADGERDDRDVAGRGVGEHGAHGCPRPAASRAPGRRRGSRAARARRRGGRRWW